jgi:hypothetical protein
MLIHRLTYRRTNHDNLHVRGYKEEGTTTTPFDMVVLNDLDRYHLVMDVIDRVPGLRSRAAHVRQAMVDRRATHRAYIVEHGEDPRRSATGSGPADDVDRPMARHRSPELRARDLVRPSSTGPRAGSRRSAARPARPLALSAAREAFHSRVPAGPAWVTRAARQSRMAA